MKTGCEKYAGMLALKYYGEIDPVDTAELSRHMKSCPACADEYKAVSRMLKGIRYEPVDSTESERIVQKVAAKIASRSRFRRLIPAYFAGAAAVAAALVITLNTPQNISTSPVPQPTTINQSDWMAVADYDVAHDLDVIDDLDTLEALDDVDAPQDISES